jgi:hypothetical protein
MGVKLPPKPLNLTPLCIILWLNISAAPLLTALELFQTRIREVGAKTDHDVLQKTRQEVEYWFDTARAIRGADIEFY